MGFWLNIFSALSLVHIPSVKNRPEELSERTCTWTVCGVSLCYRSPLPSILSRSSHLWVFFRLMKHLQQVAAFFPALCCPCPLQPLSTNKTCTSGSFLQAFSHLACDVPKRALLFRRFYRFPKEVLCKSFYRTSFGCSVCPPTLMKLSSRLSPSHISY